MKPEVEKEVLSLMGELLRLLNRSEQPHCIERHLDVVYGVPVSMTEACVRVHRDIPSADLAAAGRVRVYAGGRVCVIKDRYGNFTA